MKPAKKTYVVFCLIVLMAVSCGPVTPVATPIRSPAPATPTSKPVLPTQTHVLTATAAPSPIPRPRSEAYQLKPWTANDDYYSNLVEQFSQDFYVEFNADHQTYDLIFQAERLLRDPSIDWHNIAWKIVARNPRGIPMPGMRSGQDLLAFLMEDLLNNEKVKPEELPVIVKSRIQTNWECYRAEIAESPSKRGNYLIVNNLFGDKQDGWLFYTGNCEGTAVYTLRNIDGQYRVEKVRDWQALEITFAGYSLLLDTVGDVNNNGIPEVAINVSYGASGTPPFIGENLEIYEWDSSKKIFLSGETEMFEVVCFDWETCDDGWRVERTNIQGAHPVIVKELVVTMYDDFGESSVCDHLVVEHTYLWKNGNFIEQKQTILPPSDERMECQLSWALQVLNRRAQESTIAAEIISEALADWPDSMNETWGPVSRDYFALRLGLVYDVTGHEDAALALIREVAQHPSNPEYNFIPQLASTYLDVRSKRGKVQACQEINLLQKESADQLDDNVFFRPLEKFREIWGVSAPIWMYRVDDICSDIDTLELLLQQAQSSQYKNIDEWLMKIGLEPVSVKPIYESNALTAWLVTLPVQSLELADNDSGILERVNQQQSWLFTKTPYRLNGAYVDDMSANASLSVDYLDLNGSGLLVTIQPHDAYTKRLDIFHVDFDGAVNSQLFDFYVDGFVNHYRNEIATITDGAEPPEIAVYNWNNELNQLDKKLINFDFSNAQVEAERLLFQEREFLATILYIKMFLVQAPPEPKEFTSCYVSDCTYYPDWYQPYTRYLLALAYEMSGQTEQARDTYFALWNAYPDNIFGLAAEHRLTPVTP